MRMEPDLWLKLRPVNSPLCLSQHEFEALKLHLGSLARLGCQVAKGHEKDWAWCLGVRNDWLEKPFSDVEASDFSIVGLMVFARYLRNAHKQGDGQLQAIKYHIRELIAAGVKVGGGEERVEVLFNRAEDWDAWAENPPPQFPQRGERSPFCTYPRQL